MLTPKEFYLGYQSDYFAYRQLRLKKELEEATSSGFRSDLRIHPYVIEDHIRSIKIDIRCTYFQSIETLFELIFSFEPVNNNFRDEQLLTKLLKKKDHYEEIRQFAENGQALDWLFREFTFSNQRRISGLEYLFFGINENQEIRSSMPESIPAITSLLKILAKDLSDRSEYNSYKHGFRILPVHDSFAIFDQESLTEVAKWDTRDSMTFVYVDGKSGLADKVTKVFDSVRDISLTIMCNNLISNLIVVRRASYKNPVTLVTFRSQDVERAATPNVGIQEFRIRTVG